MRYFYASPDQISLDERQIILSQSERDHIAQVLRLKPGDRICVLDGLGKRYYATIFNISSGRVIVHVDLIKEDRPRRLKLHLFQSLPKLDKFEFIIQKATELGVASITPMICKRSLLKVSEPQKRLERWKKISIEASKQSGNAIFSDIGEVLSFQEALSKVRALSCDLNLILWEAESQISLKSAIQNRLDAKQISVLIGSEGSFEKEEVSLAKDCGAVSVSIGGNILRSETAAIATCAIILYQFGELGN